MQDTYSNELTRPIVFFKRVYYLCTTVYFCYGTNDLNSISNHFTKVTVYSHEEPFIVHI